MKWLAPLLLAPGLAWGSVGTITEQAGPAAEIQRERIAIEANKGTGVEMNDTVSTTNTRLGITFEDNTRVQLTEQTRLVIDDFVYDPSQGTGRMTMNVAMGTVRMASGATARNSRENVRITTPTATISVRGTDFTMTVDEVGRSLVILLPTCPDPGKPDECWTGSIEVSTDAGYVLMNQAYQATMVDSANQVPSEPKIVNVDESLIDNLLIISPPSNLMTNTESGNVATENDTLSQDLLEYNELAKNYLEEDAFKSSQLDINRLDVEYLDNLLDQSNQLAVSDEPGENDVLPTVGRHSWVQWAYSDEEIYLYSERPPHIAEIKIGSNTNGMVNITQDGVAANIQINDGGTGVLINIVQNQ